jgi:hypothetical protein
MKATSMLHNSTHIKVIYEEIWERSSRVLHKGATSTLILGVILVNRHFIGIACDDSWVKFI